MTTLSHLSNAFRRGTLHQTPFPHFATDTFLPAELADEILEWLEATNSWVRKEEPGFYRCSGFRVSVESVPPCARFLFDAPFCALLGIELARLFGLRLDGRFQIGAQLLNDGDEMLVHTDFGPDRQAVRAIVHFNRGWSVERGGLFVVLDSATDPRESQVYAPVHNSLFAFPISQRSHHGVTLVRSGSRYSLAFSTMTRDCTEDVEVNT